MRIASAWAGLGAAVGAALLLVLRFVAGPSVLEGIRVRVDGLPRRYVDYGPSGSAGWHLDARALSVVLGAGLVAGLLIGVVLRFATGRRARRAGGPLLAAALGVSGVVVGTLLAVLLHVDGSGVAPGRDFGWYAYSPLSSDDGVFYGGGADPSWWPLVLTGAVVGLVVGGVAAGGLLLARRRG